MNLAMAAPSHAPAGPMTLGIDIGGTGLKMLVVDPEGEPVNERARVRTPHPARPDAVLEALTPLIAAQPGFDRVSIGFPGVVRDGIVWTAVNLHDDWVGFDLAAAAAELCERPVRVCNDADMSGFASIDGTGVEVVLTLGTGLGSAVFIDGRLVPNLELGHHPLKGRQTYEGYVGHASLKEIGKKKWRKRVRRVIDQIGPIWNPRALYLGGGNARHLRPEDLPDHVHIRSNRAGMLGGVALWAES